MQIALVIEHGPSSQSKKVGMSTMLKRIIAGGQPYFFIIDFSQPDFKFTSKIIKVGSVLWDQFLSSFLFFLKPTKSIS